VSKNTWSHECALGMLKATGYEGEDLPIGLRNFLDDCDLYCSSLHGRIQSRQVVALALATYRKFYSLTQPLPTEIKS